MDLEVGAPENSAQPSGVIRQRWVNAAKIVLGVAMIAYLVHLVDADNLADRLAKMNRWTFALAVIAGVLQYAGFAVRWCVLARCADGRLPFTQALIGNFELAFVTQVAPTAVAGDAARVARATAANLTLSQAVSSVLLDRLFGLLVLAIVAPLMLVIAKGGETTTAISILLGLTFAALAGGLMALVLAERLLKPWAETRWARFFISVSKSLQVLFRRPKYTAIAAAASFGGYLLTTLCFTLVAASLGVALQLSYALPAVAAITLATFAPVSIGGWGVREGASVVILGFVGISAADALAASIGFGIVQTLVGLIGGVVWLASGYKRSR